MKFIRRIADVLGSDADGNDATESDDAPDPAGLYECEDCDTTYISTEMETCPDCRDGVEAVPNERDLGLV